MKITATLLILSSVLHVKANPGVVHKDIVVSGCSDTDTNTDAEFMFALDGEVVFYADFNKGKLEMPQPKFVRPITVPAGYQFAFGQQQICKQNLKALLTAWKNPPVKQEAPHAMIYTKDEVELGVDNVLICHVTGFYPAPVHITWTRNNHNVTSDITASIPYLNKDRTFYQFSSVKFRPEQGDIYSCTVNHQSLTEPESRMWDVDYIMQDQSSVGPDVFCGVGLTLGLLGVAIGTVFLIKGNECN